jgi:TolB-like protein/class 3 adenylate cyclase
MGTDGNPQLDVEIAYVLLIDVVGYSKLLIDEQREVQQQLTEIVRENEEVRIADTQGKLLRLPTGDGVALVFSNAQEAPVRCAVQIAEALERFPQVKVRMGINTGPVTGVSDLNQRSNIAGAGINIAQRVMDLGDAGHILLSKRAAEDLMQYRQWQPHLHELGEVEVKHDVKIAVVNFCTGRVGNPELPARIKQARGKDRMRRFRKRALGIATLVLGMGLLLFLRQPWRSTPPREKSIAVLPFENLSKDQENAFFAGGVQDEILSNLSKVADLKVISRTSVMQYRTDAGRNLRDIARSLGVAHVVEGSVQRVGGRVRVTAQLIDARTDTHLWAEHYDRDFADIFAIQSEIAQKIADQLRVKLSPEEKAVINDRPTTDLEAYALYTEAKELNNFAWKEPEKRVRRQIELLEQATQRDPKFALAYCFLSDAQLDLWALNEDPAPLQAARAAAETAVGLRPDLGESHLARARYYFAIENFDSAGDELVVAGRLLPNEPTVLFMEGRIDRRRNRWDEALTKFNRAAELDPRNPEIAMFRYVINREMRRYQESERLAEFVATTRGANELRWVLSADVQLDAGDVARAQSFLAKVGEKFDRNDSLWTARLRTALYLRDYDSASRIIGAVPADIAPYAFEGQPPHSWADAQLAHARRDMEKTRLVCAQARKDLEDRWTGQDKEKTGMHAYFPRAAIFDAGQGRKEEAIREARHAVDLCPISKDAIYGAVCIRFLALVYAWTGEREQALQQLERIAKIPTGPSYGELRFDPAWDDLRGDPRFAQIVAEAKAATQ